MRGDLTSHGAILTKGFLFLLTGFLAAGILIADHPDPRTILLLAVCVWSFCRFYYFAFYVIEHYVDGQFRFAGFVSFGRFLWKRRNVSDDNPPRSEFRFLQHATCESPEKRGHPDADRSAGN